LTAYLDTSFVMPLVRPEARSRDIGNFLRQSREIALATSHWTRVEFCSVIARDVRMKTLRPPQAKTAISDFEQGVLPSFSLWAVSRKDCELARDYLQTFETGLRSGVALHLAIAVNNRADMIYTLDGRMLQAGALLGLPVSRGIALK
jgi:predicted nucleic acid-binding protein